MNRREISKVCDDGTMWNCFVDRNGSCRVLWSKIPVILEDSLSIKKGEDTQACMSWEYPHGIDGSCDCGGEQIDLMVVDEVSSLSYVQLVTGLICNDTNNSCYLVEQWFQVRASQAV